jgi:hypothetical protein
VRPRAATVAGLTIAVLAIAAGSASAKPVPAKLLRYLRSGPLAFRLAGPAARPHTTASVAERDAVREAQWHPASAYGASLVRVTITRGRRPVLAWLVALLPRHPVRDGSRNSPGPAANYVVAFIAAADGGFIGDAAGYSPTLGGHAGGWGWAKGEFAGRGSFVT